MKSNEIFTHMHQTHNSHFLWERIDFCVHGIFKIVEQKTLQVVFSGFVDRVIENDFLDEDSLAEFYLNFLYENNFFPKDLKKEELVDKILTQEWVFSHRDLHIAQLPKKYSKISQKVSYIIDNIIFLRYNKRQE